jgi:NAD(P)-dependent dehydrogenase (short-subunit alcohol dehydrogenase family)
MFYLKDKVAIVTGASGGLGEAMAISLAEQGAQIAIFDVKDKEGHEVVKRLKTKSKFYYVDLQDEQKIKDCIDHVAEEFGRIDILINNAGVYYPTPMDNLDKAAWDKMIAINLTGPLLMTKYAVPYMKKGSKIINVASVAGHHAFGSSVAYNSSKGGVIMLTKSLATEYAQRGINVNCICPGSFITPISQDMQQSDAFKELLKNNVPLQRTGQPHELSFSEEFYCFS